MSNFGRVLKGIAALLAFATFVACSPVFSYHGYAPTDDELSEIEVGLDTRATVTSIIGKPGTSGILADSGWYYVRSEFEHAPVAGPRELDRQVVAISFDEDGVVTNIERFGLERGEVVVLTRRVTDSNIEGVSFLTQLFGNVGSQSSLAKLFN